MTSTPSATTAGREVPVQDHEPSRPAGLLRLAIVGENADELGLRIAERHGLVATSMDGLMKGRKGRKTDNVKAKAAAEWLGTCPASTGGVLTGFPTTATQAELLEKQGVGVEQLVLLERAGAAPEEAANESEGGELHLLTSRLEGKVVKLPSQQDVDSLCDSAASLLAASGGQQRSSAALRDVDDAPAPPAKAAETSALPPSTLRDADMMMSPSELAVARAEAADPEPEGVEAADHRRARSRAGAKAKRAEKAAIRRKKRMANEAQQLDTPFYVAVAQGGPKARFRPPVPMVPSRITERLSSAASPGSGEEDGGGGGGAAVNTRLDFGPLVLDSPASDCLLAAGITEPTGIQQAGMGPILNGESVILHAMTGSGKTLTFLLPLMQRWTPGLLSTSAAAAASAGVNGERASDKAGGGVSHAPWQLLLALPTRELAVQVAREVVLLSGGLTASVELLVDANTFHDLSKVTAPIVVGSAKVLERRIRKSRPTVREDVLPRIKCIVVDEVDRLVDVLSKHAPAKEAEKRKRHARPIAALLERVLAANGEAQCRKPRAQGHPRRLLRVVGPKPGHRSGAVVIPDTIRHYCVPLGDGDFFSRLEGLTAAVRELQPRRPLIFVPPQERVTAVVAHLRRAGGAVGARAVALHEAMGFVSDEDFGVVRGRHFSEAIEQHDRLVAGQSLAGGGEGGGREPRGGEGGGGFEGGAADESGVVTGAGGSGSSSGHLLAGGVGPGGMRLRNGDGDAEVGDVLVTGEGSARGLHFDDVDFVFLMQKPKSPDEYVHLAGRTGRQGKTGTVVSLVEFEEFRKLQGWSYSLKVNFEPLDILNVLKR
ncbi:DEAD box helicase [Ectocarpus siliculosus]|uniref:RNA helicase n=1 Tax=Ectocarpus siliculosus TaxID=2880 RepID=D8LJZ7_ECTSI|nr:DEAD box helicase [Ectocarpus siliculosus]|eukprot:CBN74466.1 DEAD box helicase [Ectocarpus siliculosus]